jgi:eukaryotic-like serine/threonine-protein kinase
MSPRFRRRPPVDPDATQPLPRVEERVTGEYGYTETVVDEPPPPRRGPLLWPYLLLLLLLVLGGIAALYYFTREEDETKPVPAVVQLPVDDAVNRLTEEGFTTDVRQEANEAEEGTVFEQRPDGGEEAEEGSTVTLLVSRGPAETTVPNVVGLRLEAALEKLDEAELGARQRGVFSEEPRGTVVAQDPAGGGKAPRNSRVRINVSRGTGRVDVPGVVGQTASDAGANLREVGLQARVVNVPSAEPEGTVVAQNPRAGTELGRGEFVRINVSTGQGAAGGGGAGAAAIPDVTGLTEDDATSELEAAGFAVRVVPEPTPNADEEGVVVRQEPAAGERGRRGDEVTVFVGELTG